MATKLNYGRVNRQRLKSQRRFRLMQLPRAKVARPPTAAELAPQRNRPPVTLPRVKWLERPDP